ncbi:MAG: CotH kinase family protein [SAR324 cluster bacterium]|nr:CotH kinase family protein [SAR324 cluster bacterium]
MTILSQIKENKAKFFLLHLYLSTILVFVAVRAKFEYKRAIEFNIGHSLLGPLAIGSILFFLYYRLIKKVNSGWLQSERNVFLQKVGWFHASFYILVLFPLQLEIAKYGSLNDLLGKIIGVFLIVLLLEVMIYRFGSFGVLKQGMSLKQDARMFNPLKFVPSIAIVKIILFLLVAVSIFSLWSESKGVLKAIKIQKVVDAQNENASTAKIQTLNIKIRPEHFLKIKRVVDKYKTKKVLREKQYYPAVIEQNGKTIPIQMRLKGDWTDHIKTNKKWSFRIVIKSDDSFMGMKTFSIQHPSTRHWLNEWVFIKYLQSVDILAPHYSFINVTLNGESWGVYAIEEGFAKQLLESQNRREGVIIKMREDALWDYIYNKILLREQKLKGLTTGLVGFGDHIDEVIAFGTGKIQKSPDLNAAFSAAAQKLNAFRRGEASVKDTFDIEKMAKYHALIDRFSAYHGIRYHNRRYYYSPVTGLLEPIHFDGATGAYTAKYGPLWGLRTLSADNHNDEDPMNALFFRDPYFLERYLFYAKEVSQPKYLKEFKHALSPELRKMHKLVRAEWPTKRFDWKKFDRLAVNMRGAWNTQTKAETGLMAFSDESFFDAKAGTVSLELANIRLLPVKISEIGYKLKKRIIPLEILKSDKLVSHPETGEVYIPGDSMKQTFHSISAKVPEFLVKEVGSKFDVTKLRISFKVVQSDTKLKRMVARRHTYSNIGPPSKGYDLKKTLKQHSFLTVKDRIITIAAGNWKVRGDVIIPEGYLVKAGAGVTLKFEEKAIFLSHSPLIFSGSDENPVTFTAINERWAGFIVSQAKTRSLIRNVIFEKAQWIKRKSWGSPGGVTFYESDVDFMNSELRHAKGEDGLNIVRSNFEISNSLFEDVPSDAFDGDFSVGIVRDSTFSNIRGDAVDFSGSQIQLKGLVLSNIADKAVSAGEASTITATNIVVKGANICFASKDASRLLVIDSQASDCNIGVAAFQKKPEYGGATANLKNVLITKPKYFYWLELNSAITLDGKKLPINKDNIKKQLY